jgi:hypothetical protein
MARPRQALDGVSTGTASCLATFVGLVVFSADAVMLMVKEQGQ